MVALIVEGTCKHAFSFSHCLLTIVRSHISTPSYCTMHCFLCAPHGMRVSYDVRSLLADAAWRCGSFQTGPRVRARLRSLSAAAALSGLTPISSLAMISPGRASSSCGGAAGGSSSGRAADDAPAKADCASAVKRSKIKVTLAWCWW